MAEKASTTTSKANLQDGDVVRFDYTLYVDGKMVETSEESVAKENGIHRAERRYNPLTVALGQRQIIPGLESHIRSHGVLGQKVKAEIPAAEAYGERHADKVKDVPMAQFRAQKVTPQVGMTLNLQGERGVVTRVAGGRVRVDLNHDLAGKPLTYEYTIRKVLSDETEKVEAVLEHMFRPGTFKVHHKADAIELEVPDAAKFDESWTMAKFRVVSSVRAAAPKKAIKLVEVYPAGDDKGLVPGHEGHAHGADHEH